MSLCLLIWVLASLCLCVCVSVCVCVSLGLWVSGSLVLWVPLSLCLCVSVSAEHVAVKVRECFGHLPLGDQIELTILLLYISSQQNRSAYEMFSFFYFLGRHDKSANFSNHL